jgi:hypothetical protein
MNMAGKVMFAIVIALTAGSARSDECGWMNMAASDTKCFTDAASCNTGTCCTSDASKCGSLAQGLCGDITDKYRDASKAGVTWGTTSANKNENCCTAKAKCDTFTTCPATHQQITAAATTNCPTDAASCTASLCCTLDTAKCAGASVICVADTYKDPAKAGVTAGTTDAAKKAACCTAKAKCDTIICPAHNQKITAAATTNCPTDAASCTAGACCTPDTAKCVGASVACVADKYKDPLKAGVTAGTTDAAKKAACCTAKATCASFQQVVSRASKSETMVTLFLGMFAIAAMNN